MDRKDLSKLVYLEAVIKETLRLYPIGPIVARHVEKELKLSESYSFKPTTTTTILAQRFRISYGRYLDLITLPEIVAETKS